MRLQTAMLARYAETEPQGGLLNITGGGVDIFGMRALPAEFAVALALQLTFDASEAEREHELTLIVMGPDLQPVGQEMQVLFTPRFGEHRAPGWLGIFAVTGGIRLRVEALGAHSLQIRLDGELAGDIPFLTVQG